MANGLRLADKKLFENVTPSMKFSEVTEFKAGTWLEDEQGNVCVRCCEDVVFIQNDRDEPVVVFYPESGNVSFNPKLKVCPIRFLTGISYVTTPVGF